VIEQKQVEYWKQYQSKGRVDHRKQIMLLEQELIDMQSTFDEMACKSFCMFYLTSDGQKQEI
jgi:hypothetical protein